MALAQRSPVRVSIPNEASISILFRGKPTMKLKRKQTALMTIPGILAFALASNSALAQTVLTENFDNSASFAGQLYGSEAQFSQAWSTTFYYAINNADGWTFFNGAQYATDGTGNGALLLNENTPSSAPVSSTSPEAVVTLNGLNLGQTYNVAFNYWGDNEPGGTWTLNGYLNGNNVYSLNGADATPGVSASAYAGSLPNGFQGGFSFIATNTSETLGFGQSNSGGGASPIIDNVSVSSAVPEPSSVFLMLGGIGVLAACIGKKGRPVPAHKPTT
jgi:hypothetical protein